MQLHQVLTGSCNKNEQCLSCGSIQNKAFVTYVSGCDLVVLDNDFNRVQVIPGVTHGNVQIAAVDSCQETGRIAASYGKTVCVYDPEVFTVQSNANLSELDDTNDDAASEDEPHGGPSHGVGLCLGSQQRCRWFLSARIEARGAVFDLSWAPIGEGLLTAGHWLQMWHPKETKIPVFSLDVLDEAGSTNKGLGGSRPVQWTEAWSYCYDRVHIAGHASSTSVTVSSMLSRKSSLSGAGTSISSTVDPAHSSPTLAVRRVVFSADGTMFATLSYPVVPPQHNKVPHLQQQEELTSAAARCVLIWYRERPPPIFAMSTDSGSGIDEQVNYRYLVLRHPAPVTACSWRRTSRYMPEGCVSNVLLTSCKDQVCRIWCESRAHLQQGFCSVQSDLSVQPSSSGSLVTPRGSAVGPAGAAGSITSMAYEFRSGFLKHLDRLKISKADAAEVSSESSLGTAAANKSFSNIAAASQQQQRGNTVWHHSQAYPHFAMVATINANTDIPLAPTVPHSQATASRCAESDFILHWLHNKEMYFTAETERIVEEMTSNMTTIVNEASAMSITNNESSDKPSSSPAVNPELYLQKELSKLDVKLDQMLADWSRSPDVLFLIRPIDGSLLVWMVHWLDESAAVHFDDSGGTAAGAAGRGSANGGGSASCRLRHVQVSVHSRLPQAMPLADASTLGSNLLIYNSGPRRFCAATRLLNQLQYERERWARLRQEMDHSEWMVTDQPSSVPTLELPKDSTDKTSSPSLSGRKVTETSNEPAFAYGNTGVVLVTHHSNGSLNQWHVSLTSTGGGSGTNSHTVSNTMSNITSAALSVSHGARISGHRFHTNSAVCHPQLPLLLTTSHHNESPEAHQLHSALMARVEDTSELIMWRVDAVGPLSRAPGITELARINSTKQTAFSSVAWFPTLLPSYVLGIESNSPAALFLASMPPGEDMGPRIPSPSSGEDLRLYLAIIDAGQLLVTGSLTPGTPGSPQPTPGGNPLLGDYPVVSLQSTANPGCLVELESLQELSGKAPESKATPHNLRNYLKTLDSHTHHVKTLLLHVFTEEMVLSESCISSNVFASGNNTGKEKSIPAFDEFYYIVRLLQVTSCPVSSGRSKENESRVTAWMQMWRVRITGGRKPVPSRRPRTNAISTPTVEEEEDSTAEVKRTRSARGISFKLDEKTSASTSGKAREPKLSCSAHDLGIHTVCEKVCEQNLSELLSPECKILHTNVAAGHLSSANIYPACFSPYLITTACSDGFVRFWKCLTTQGGTQSSDSGSSVSFEWEEWPLIVEGDQSSRLPPPEGIQGKPLYISCAYSGRVAIAYEVRDESSTPHHHPQAMSSVKKSPRSAAAGKGSHSQTMHLCVAIYECESTGGAGWVLEDTLELGHIAVPLLMLSSSDCWPLPHHSNAAATSNKPFLGNLGRSGTLDDCGKRTFTTFSRNESIDRSEMPHLDVTNSPFSPPRPNLNTQSSLYYDDFEEHPMSGSATPPTIRHRISGRSTPEQQQQQQHGTHMQSSTLRLKPKRAIQLDWVSTEDGSHMLSVAVGTQILIYAPVCREVVLATASRSTRRTLMVAGSVRQHHQQMHWLKLRVINLASADDLPPFPLHCSWVREGLLVVGLDNELHVYSQWRTRESHKDTMDWEKIIEGSGDLGKDLLPIVKSTSKLKSLANQSHGDSAVRLDTIAVPTASMTMARLTKTYSTFGLSKSGSTHNMLQGPLSVLTHTATDSGSTKGKSSTTAAPPSADVASAIQFVAFIRDIGLFEAVQVCNPILPQYHPKQLMEWMNFGKLRRVKAILAHLTRCVAAPTSRRRRGKSGSRPSDGWHGSSSSSCDESTSTSDDDSMEESAVGGGLSGVELERIHKGTLERSLTIKAATGASGAGTVENSGWSTIRAIPPLPLYVLLAVDSALTTGTTSSPGGKPAGKKAEDDDFALLNNDDTSQYLHSSGSEDAEDPNDDKAFYRRKRRLKRQRTASSSKKSKTILDMCNFTPRHAAKLSEKLARLQLPGLSALDQMYLMGIAELMANTRSEVTERLSRFITSGGGSGSSAGVSGTALGGMSTRTTVGGGFGGYAAPEGSLMGTTDSLDDCGLRFLLAMQHHSYMLRTLPMQQRQLLQARGMNTADIAWAFHSEGAEELLHRIPGMAQDQLTWSEFRQYGCGFWVRNDNILRRCVEKIAKTAYQSTRDPMDTAIFYLAMKKPKIVAGLFKTSDNRTLEEFFRSDFNDAAARRKAKVNAFNLLSKRRFQHAAGLFLVAGSLSDALQVCINKLHDLQLALTVARLYESSVETGGLGLTFSGTSGSAMSPALETLWKEHVLTSPDPFLRSMAHWTLGDHEQALNTLLQLDGQVGSPTDSGSSSAVMSPRQSLTPATGPPVSLASELSPHPAHSHDDRPSVFNFYVFLRQSPLLVRLRAVKQKSGTPAKGPEASATWRIHSAAERRLYFNTAYRYSQIGCPALALEVLSQLPERMNLKSKLGAAVDMEESKEEVLNILAPAGTPSTDAGQQDALFQWSAFDTTSTKLVDDDFKIEFSDDDDEEDDDDAKEKSPPTKPPTILEPPPTSSVEVDKPEVPPPSSTEEGPLDVMAQQLKFVACLRLMCEELSTLATGIEPNGAHLRYHFYQWLEREVIVLQKICNYQTRSLDECEDPHAATRSRSGTVLWGAPDSSLKEIQTRPRTRQLSTSGLLATLMPGQDLLNPDAGTDPTESNKSETERRLELYESRQTWLFTHQALLHSLASFCSLQGASGVGLASLRMELLLLLQELHQHQQVHGSLQAKLPPSVHLPLISAVLSPTRTVLANPIQHIRFLVRDIMDTVCSLSLPHATTSQVHDVSHTKSVEHAVLLLRNLSIALSACIYQGLCESKSVAAMFLRRAAAVNPREKPEMMVLENLTTHFLRTMNNVVYSDGCELLLRRRRLSSSETAQPSGPEASLPNSEPKKWPGTVTVLTLLTGGSVRAHSPEQASKLAPFLCEVEVAVYLGLLLFSLHSCDTGILYRLTSHSLDRQFWARVFGGVLRKPTTGAPGGAAKPERPPPPNLSVPSSGSPQRPASPQPQSVSSYHGATVIRPSIPARGGDGGPVSLGASISESPGVTISADSQRVRLINRVAPPRPEKPRVEEIFIQPQVSIVSALMEKPQMEGSTASQMDFVYDSAEEENSEYADRFYQDRVTGDASDTEEKENETGDGPGGMAPQNVELLEPTSFSWHLLRLAVLQRALERIQHLMHMLDFEPAEVGSSCSHLFECVKRLRVWQQQSVRALQSPQCRVPPHFLERLQMSMNSSATESSASSRAVQRYRALLNRDNTPFDPITMSEALSAKRLWCYLVRQDTLHDVFMRYVYATNKMTLPTTTAPGDSGLGGDMKSSTASAATNDNMIGGRMLGASSSSGATKLVHKEQDALYSLCVNQANLNCIAVCTAKDVIELDIGNLLSTPAWLEDDIEYDIEVIRNPLTDRSGDEFVLLERPLVSGTGGGASMASGSAAGDKTSFQTAHFVPSAPGVLPAPRDTLHQHGAHHGTTMFRNFPLAGPLNLHAQQQTGLAARGDEIMDKNRRLLRVIQKRTVSNVLKMASHPSLPYYMCVTGGTQMFMFEWDSKQPIINAFSSSCHKGKLHALKFDSNGRKFGVGDTEGIFALWHLSLAANMSSPFFTCRAHRRGIHDFTFLQSASVLCTAGIPANSSGGGTGGASMGAGGGGGGAGGVYDCGADVSLAVWDTLMPQGRNAVQQYNDSVLSGGCTVVATVGQQHTLLVGTKRGEIAWVDLRQGAVRSSFLAHEAAIKSLIVDPLHHFVASGAADGSVKVWSLNGNEIIASFRGEHNRGGASALFRQSDLGTTHLALLPEVQLLSCGGDGSIRMRNLADLV